MIAVDWGTSSLRLYRLDAEGHVYERRRSEQGLQASAGQFEAVLAQEIAGWDDALILLSGMVGSRSGWREVPYLPCPTGIDELAGALVPLQAPTLAERTLWIVPGISDTGNDAVPDVMRGEEIQIAGALLLEPAWSVRSCMLLPGTHSKWAQIEDGRIVRYATYLTGELFAVLSRHSILGRLMPVGNEANLAVDPDAFALGLDTARRSGPGDLSHQLFGTRTLGLTGRLPSVGLADYLSGLLIGHELVSGLAGAGELVDAPLVMIGAPALCGRYAGALAHFGRAADAVLDNTAPTGLWNLALAAGKVAATQG